MVKRLCFQHLSTGHYLAAEVDEDPTPDHMRDKLRGELRLTLANENPVLKFCFGPPTAESKNLKNHVNFDVGDLFF